MLNVSSHFSMRDTVLFGIYDAIQSGLYVDRHPGFHSKFRSRQEGNCCQIYKIVFKELRRSSGLNPSFKNQANNIAKYWNASGVLWLVSRFSFFLLFNRNYGC